MHIENNQLNPKLSLFKTFSNFNHVVNSQNTQENTFNLNEKKRAIVEKIAVTLKLKYLNIFKSNNYTTKTLISDLNKLISIKDINKYERNITIAKIEQFILNIIFNPKITQNLIPNEREIKTANNPIKPANKNLSPRPLSIKSSLPKPNLINKIENQSTYLLTDNYEHKSTKSNNNIRFEKLGQNLNDRSDSESTFR